MKHKNTSTPPPSDTPPPSEPWINSTAACLHLGVSMPTMRRWINLKKLTPKRTPTGDYRFRRSELDKLLE
jgi:excisionase family DNA binding protein